MLKEKRAEKHVTHGIKQVELLNYLLNNLSQFNLKPTTKLVLLYLAGCYNPKHADVFPKQKTIALQMGISERSVISAIQELHKEGLVISERKYTNRYKFTSRILNLGGMEEDFLQSEEVAEVKCKDCTLQSEKSAPLYIEQEEEQKENKQESIEDFKILRDYAVSKGARNVAAYVAVLKRNGSAQLILDEQKKKVRREQARSEAIDRFFEDKRKEDAELAKTAQLPQESEAWRKLGEMFGMKK